MVRRRPAALVKAVDWSLRGRLFVGYGIVLSLVAVVVIWSLVLVNRLGRASDAILRENYRSIIAAEHMIDALERQDSALLLMLLGDSEAGAAQFRDNETEFLQYLGRAADNITIDGEAEVIEAIRQAYTAYLAAADLDPPASGDLPAARRRYQSRLLPLFQTVRDECGRLRELNQAVMFAASSNAHRLAWKSTATLAIVGTAILLLGLFFSLLLANLISRPLRQMIGGLQQIAAGQYDIELPRTSSDELGVLAAEFNTMARQLQAYRDLSLEQTVAQQRQVDAVLNSIADGLLVVGSDLTVTDLNRVAARMFGTDRETARGRHLLEVVDARELFEQVREVVEAAGPPRLASAPILALPVGDEVRHYQLTISKIRGDEPHPGAVILLTDVTRLKELDRLKTEFVMTASHELRTPLTGIGMSVALLRERAEAGQDPQAVELLEVAEDDVTRLRALVDDLLDLSKLEAGKVDLDRQPLAVGVLLAQAAGLLRGQFEEKGITLTVEPVEDGLRVEADATKITWVLTNLLANALRFTPAGGRVSLAADRLAGQARLSVADTGAGIPAEAQSRIFDKFVQVEGQVAGGTGLGLAICREIVRAHRGSIWVESEVGQGSTFSFTLPLTEPTVGGRE